MLARLRSSWLARATCARRAAPLLLAWLASVIGCGEEQRVPATSIVVSVNSDLQLELLLTRVEVELRDFEGKGPAVETRAFSVTQSGPRENQVRLPFSFGIVRGTQNRFRMTLRGYGPDSRGRDKQLLQQTLISSFQTEQTLLLKIFLGSVCLDKLCMDEGVEATCYAEPEGDTVAGECGPIPERTSLDVLPLDADPHAWTQPDAGRQDSGVRDAQLDATLDAAPEPLDSRGPSEAEAEAALPEAGLPEAAPPLPKTLEVSIAKDGDDVTWVDEMGSVKELFRYRDNNDSGRHLEIGNDEDPEYIGLRFVLPLTKGAVIQSATLRLQRFPYTDPAYPRSAADTETMKVQVFDSAQVPEFVHQAPRRHTDSGLVWPQAVTGFALGAPGATTESPELGALVQHVIDRTEWAPGASVTFLLGIDQIRSGYYADFTDSSAGAENAARLALTYLEP